MNRFLGKLLKDKAIDCAIYDSLYTTGSQPGILYGLPKIHKESVPLCPIISVIVTCGYKIAKFLVPQLESLIINEFTVKDSFSFVSDLKKSKQS